jgi:hypothetical protein
MSAPRSARHWLLGIAALLVVLALALVLARRSLAAMMISTSLRWAGADHVQLAVAEASPWYVELTGVSLSYRARQIAAGQVTFDRRHWWQVSLGTVRVDDLRVPVTLDGSDTNPWAWTTYSGGGGGAALSGTLPALADQVTIDGVVVVQVAGQPTQELRVHFDARLDADRNWTGRADASASGFEVHGEGSFARSAERIDFQISQVEVDLHAWEGFLQQIVPLPGGRWEMAGSLVGSVRGSYVDKRLSAEGSVQLRDGRFVHPDRNVTARGVRADFNFVDFDLLISKPGTVHIDELRVGEIVASDLDFQLAFAGPEVIAVHRATLRALGGRLSAEPFKFFPRHAELEATLVADGIVVEQVLALAKDVPAKATGLVDGRVPIRIDASGLRFGSGYLELKRGAYAEIQFNASGLLTRGVAPNNPSYATLQQVESGLLRLRLSELRLDLRPADAPPGRSATIRMAGQPVDPTVNAPVSLNLNVNGPLEHLLNLGLDSRIRFGR